MGRYARYSNGNVYYWPADLIPEGVERTTPWFDLLDELLEWEEGNEPYNPPKPKSNDGQKFYNRKIKSLIAAPAKTGDIGLEIECEGTHLFQFPLSYWMCHEDNSLREFDGHKPVEYVLRSPLTMEELPKALDYLDRKLKESNSTIIKSTRTSVHVHINCQQLTVRQLYCFILLYIIFEEALIDWHSPERAGNLFTLRAKDSNTFICMLEELLETEDFSTWHQDKRYTACNVTAIPKFGSLEFRSLKGTVDTSLILTWVKLLMHIKEKASGFDNPVEIVELFQQLGPLPFFGRIFSGTPFYNLLVNTHVLHNKLWEGLRLMRDVAYASKWEKPIPAKKKKESKKQDSPELEPTVGKVYVGDNYFLNGIYHAVQEHYSPEGENYYTTEGTTDWIPADHTLYYIRPSISVAWFKIDCRPGEPETRPN